MESSTTHLKLPSEVGLRRFLGTRNGTIAIAILTALAALAVLLSFMRHYRQSLVTEAASVTVLVAKQTIQKGTPGGLVAQQRLFATKALPKDKVTPMALADTGLLRDTTAARDIYPGQQLTPADFVAGADPITSQLGRGQRAVSVPVDGTHGNLGQIAAGSHVDVLGSPKAATDTGAKPPAIYVLARDILVLKAPGDGSAGAGAAGGAFGGGGSGSDVVLRLATNEMRPILTTADKGTIWLLVRPPTVARELKLGRL